MPTKKNKVDEEPLKPLSFYVKDRLELTKQLFSCLKSKQIKSRLPSNLQVCHFFKFSLENSLLNRYLSG